MSHLMDFEGIFQKAFFFGKELTLFYRLAHYELILFENQNLFRDFGPKICGSKVKMQEKSNFDFT